MQFRKFAPLLFLLITSALYATDYAPDTLWSRQIEIEGFSSLEAKCSALTPDGGLLIGCYGKTTQDDRVSVFIKCDNEYNIEWHTEVRNMLFGFWRNDHIRVMESGNYDVFFADEILHLSSQGDSLGITMFGMDHIDDAIQISTGEYFLLTGALSCVDSMGNIQWQQSYPGWIRIRAIAEAPNGYYIIAGAASDPNSVYGDYLKIGLIDEQGLLVYEDQSSASTPYGYYIQLSLQDNICYMASIRNHDDTGIQITKIAFDFSEPENSRIIHSFLMSTTSMDSKIVRTSEDGGALVFGVEMKCFRYYTDGNLMWMREYDFDNDENEEYHEWNDYQLDAYQNDDGSFTMIANDWMFENDWSNAFYRLFLIKTAPELTKGIVAVGNNEARINNPIFNTSQMLTWYSWGDVGNVNIELSRHVTNGPWEMLVEDTPNDGNENLFYSPPEAEFCYLRISSVDSTVQAITDWSFSVVPNRRTIYFQQADNPGIYLTNYDFGDIEYGVNQSMFLSTWGASHWYYSPYLYSIRQQMSGHFSAASSNGIPGSLEDCLIEISIFPDFLGNTTGILGFVTNSHQGDSLYSCTGCAFIDSALTTLYVSANVVVTPAPPEITLSRENEDILINWNPVTRSVGGYNISGLPIQYIVFRNNSSDEIEYVSAVTTETQVRDMRVVSNYDKRFYSVVAAIDTPALTQAAENWTGKSKSFVLEQISRLNSTSTLKLSR